MLETVDDLLLTNCCDSSKVFVLLKVKSKVNTPVISNTLQPVIN